MKLDNKHLDYIAWQMKKEGKSLRDILLEEYPRAEIVVVRGYDPFDDKRYVHRAFFSSVLADAETVLAGCNNVYDDPEEPVEFYTVETNVSDLSSTLDPVSNVLLDKADQKLVFMYLELSLQSDKVVD
jgi:hypothetical protein